VATADLPVYNAHILVPNGHWSVNPAASGATFIRGYNNYDISYTAVKYNAVFKANGGNFTNNPNPADVSTDGDGNLLWTDIIYNGDPATQPSDPVRGGYKFLGWCVQNCSPIGYTAVDSVRFDGENYLDTGVLTGDDLAIELDYKFNTRVADGGASNATIYGARVNADLSHFDTLQYYCGDLRVAYATVSYGKHQNFSCADADGFFTSLDRVTVKQSADGFWYNGAQLASPSDFSGTITTPLNFYLGALNNNGAVVSNGQGGWSMDVYGFKMYKSGVLVANFVPMQRDSDGAVGLYDTVGRKFYEQPVGAAGGAVEVFTAVSFGADELDCVAGEAWDFATVLAGDIELIAMWEQLPAPVVPDVPNTGVLVADSDLNARGLLGLVTAFIMTTIATLIALRNNSGLPKSS
jgi:hypothetical protein